MNNFREIDATLNQDCMYAGNSQAVRPRFSELTTSFG
jgi:hypothetical protein